MSSDAHEIRQSPLFEFQFLFKEHSFAFGASFVDPNSVKPLRCPSLSFKLLKTRYISQVNLSIKIPLSAEMARVLSASS